MSSSSGFVAVLVIHLHFPDAESLKGKRKELSSIKSQLHGRLGLAVSEVDHHDLWQRATLAAAITGRTPSAVTAQAENVERWLESRCPERLRVERVLVSVEELQDVGSRIHADG
jgi:uncharacterized protein